jgi:hypothetical protein
MESVENEKNRKAAHDQSREHEGNNQENKNN